MFTSSISSISATSSVSTTSLVLLDSVSPYILFKGVGAEVKLSVSLSKTACGSFSIKSVCIKSSSASSLSSSASARTMAAAAAAEVVFISF